jgi:hypothetical protein
MPLIATLAFPATSAIYISLSQHVRSDGVSANQLEQPLPLNFTLLQRMRFFRFPSLLVLEVYLVLSLAVHGRPTPVIQGRQGGAVTAVVDVTVFETMTPSGGSPPASTTDSSTRSEMTSTTRRTQATGTTTTGARSTESLPITTLSTSASTTTTDASSKPTSLADEEVSATTESPSTGTKEMTETGAVDTSTGTSGAKESVSEVVSTVTATSIYSEAGALITSASIQVVTVDRPVGGMLPAPVATPVQVVTANPIANPAVNPVGNPIAPRPSTVVTGRPITASTTSSSRMSRLGSSTPATASSTTATAIALVPLTTNSEGDAAPATKTESSSQNKPPKLADMLAQGISSTCDSTCAAFTDLVEECKGPNVMEDFPSANEADAQERCLCSQPDPVRECAECASGLKMLGLYGSFINRCRVDGLLTIESTKVS